MGQRAPRAADERGIAGALPWAVAAIALLALVALVAGQQVGRSRAIAERGTQTAGALPPAMGGAAGQPGAAGTGDAASPVRAPDISNMTPDERAERLFNRVMSLFEQGDTAQVQFFAPMAVQAYQQLPRMTLDQRYHLGRIGAITGVPQLAAAQADTILTREPQHLLGLILAAQGARMRGDEGTARGYDRRLLAALPTEEKRALTEYAQHANDIARAVENARAGDGA